MHQNLFQVEAVGKIKEERVDQIDYNFFFGDTGMNLICDENEIRSSIESYQNAINSKNISKANDILLNLLTKDELNKQKAYTNYLDKYEEGEITFLPTYRYENNSDKYSS